MNYKLPQDIAAYLSILAAVISSNAGQQVPFDENIKIAIRYYNDGIEEFKKYKIMKDC